MHDIQDQQAIYWQKSYLSGFANRSLGVKPAPLQPVTPGYMHSVSYLAHQAEQPDDSSPLYSVSVQLYALQGTLGEVTGWATWLRISGL